MAVCYTCLHAFEHFKLAKCEANSEQRFAASFFTQKQHTSALIVLACVSHIRTNVCVCVFGWCLFVVTHAQSCKGCCAAEQRLQQLATNPRCGECGRQCAEREIERAT